MVTADSRIKDRGSLSISLTVSLYFDRVKRISLIVNDILTTILIWSYALTKLFQFQLDEYYSDYSLIIAASNHISKVLTCMIFKV